jgi:HK97 family phage major capsid protein
MDTEAKTLAALAEAVQKTVKEELPGVVSLNMKEIKEALAGDVENIKKQIAELSTALAAKGDGDGDEKTEATRKAFVCAVMKSCAKGLNFSEAETAVKTAFMNGNLASAEGAELVFDQFLSDIVNVIQNYRVIEDITLYNVIKGDNLNIPKVVNALTTGWVAEGSSQALSKATTSNILITVKISQTLVDVSESLLDDSLSVPDLYAMLVKLIGESQAAFIEDQIFNGSGSGSNIEGICINSSVASVVLATTAFSSVTRAKITDAFGTLKTKYLVDGAGAKWYMSRAARCQLIALETTTGAPVFPELATANPTLYGAPVVETDKLPSTGGVSQVFAVYGNMAHFVAVRRKDLEVQKGYSGDGFKQGLVTIKGQQRIHGKIVFTEAFVKIVTAAS